MVAEQSEYVTVAEAREMLGVSKPHMTDLLKRGVLHAEPDVIDRRVKKIRRADVEALARTTPKRGKDAA
jgi:excisionase family DNA binding protein